MNPIWRNSSISIIYILYISISTSCVRLDTHYTGKLNFILHKNRNSNSFKTGIDEYYDTNSKIGGFNPYFLNSNPSGFLNILGTLTDSLTKKPDSTQNLSSPLDRKWLFDINKKGARSLKPPIKQVVESIIPDIYTVFKAREHFGSGPLPSLLSCSGGVDSMSLLHSFGIIKIMYEELINDIITVFNSKMNSVPFKIISETSKVDYKTKKAELMKFLKEFYDNFKVVYFNHKQREDIDKDIQVIRAACEKYKFDLIIEELPQELQSKTEVSKFGPQLMFRKWRRETCMKIIDSLSSSDSTGGNKGDLKNTERVMNFPDENLIDLHTIKTPEDLIGLKGLVFMAHHLNDNFETLLLKISRDTSIFNLGLMRLYDNLDHKNYLLVRPFVSTIKSRLYSFMEDINEKYHRDSTNDESHYERNILRKSVIPSIVAGIDGKHTACSDALDQSVNGFYQSINNLSRRCDTLKESVDKEVEMYFHYINSKYKSQPVPYSSNYTSNSHSTDAEKESYRIFYETLFKRTYGDKLNSFEIRFRNNLAYFNRIGLKFPRIFSLKELNIIPNQIVKELVLKTYIEYFNGSSVSNNNVRYILDHFTKNPFSQFIKQYCVGNHFLVHQGYFVNFQYTHSDLFRRPKVKKGSTTSVGRDNKDNNLVYYDENLNIYSHLDQLKVHVTRENNGQHTSKNNYENTNGNGFGKYYVELCLKEKMKKIDGNGSENLSTTDKDNTNDRKIHIDIRYLNEDDVVPSIGMWKNNAHSVLANADIHKLIKDEIPAFVISGTNKVIGIYGINLRAPYFCNGHQTVEYGSDQITLPLKYRITIH